MVGEGPSLGALTGLSLSLWIISFWVPKLRAREPSWKNGLSPASRVGLNSLVSGLSANAYTPLFPGCLTLISQSEMSNS